MQVESDWIEEKGYKSPGFASKRRHQKNGVSPNSPDCNALDAAVFGLFERRYRAANPKTIEEAIECSKKILSEIGSQGVATWVEHLDDMYQEIIDAGGGGSHLLRN